VALGAAADAMVESRPPVVPRGCFRTLCVYPT
jgi:hypothetical protein